MEYIYAKIDTPLNNSFTTKRIKMYPGLNKIHFHDNIELCYILTGFGRKIVGNYISDFRPDDIVLIGANVPHSWEVIESGDDGNTGNTGECIIVHFHENFFENDYFSLPELIGVFNLLKEADLGVEFRGVKNAIQLLEKIPHLSPLERHIEMLKLFNQLINIKDRKLLALPSDITHISYKIERDRNLIEKIQEYVSENIETGIHLPDVARLVCMEPSSFCRYFKKKTNMPFMDYVKNTRISIAARLLVETDKQISQICYESGYNNLANFNYYFKQVMKTTPSEYRKLFRE